MDLDKFMEELNDYGNERELWHEGIEVRDQYGQPLESFQFDGNSGLVLRFENALHVEDL